MRVIIYVVIFIQPLLLFAQDKTENDSSKVDSKWALSFNLTHSRAYSPEGVSFIGLGLKYDLGKSFSINYSLAFASNSERGLITHVSAGPILAFELFKVLNEEKPDDEYYDDEDLEDEAEMNAAARVFAFFLIFIPEGITINIRINDFYGIHPYINFLGIEHLEGKYLLCSEFGVGASIALNDHLLIIPHFGIRSVMKENSIGPVFGVSLGFKL